MCFMEIGENSDEEEPDHEETNKLSVIEAEGTHEVSLHIFHKCNELYESIDISLIDLEKVLHEHRKIQ